MLLGRERELVKRNASQSKEKNKSLVRVASSSKLPKDFFKQESYENKSCPTPNMLEFTFMKPFDQAYSVKTLKKCTRDVKCKPSLKLTF
jgi:hypothetical protein